MLLATVSSIREGSVGRCVHFEHALVSPETGLSLFPEVARWVRPVRGPRASPCLLLRDRFYRQA